MSIGEQLKAESDLLLDELKREIGLDPVEAEFVETVMVDSMNIAAEIAGGAAYEALEEEINLIKATTLNIAEAKRARVENTIAEYTQKVIGIVIKSALAL